MDDLRQTIIDILERYDVENFVEELADEIVLRVQDEIDSINAEHEAELREAQQEW